jgi:hypothetical protein
VTKRSTNLATVEDRVRLRAGDSYFLPRHAVHDVEVDRESAARTPAITLFLCAEATVKPKAYLSPEMVEFHRRNPDIKDEAVELTPEQWRRKLEATAAYLRGESEFLVLDDIVRCDTDYGFMHT